MKYLFIIISFVVFNSSYTAQENLPGETSKVAYEKAMLDMQRKNFKQATLKFNQSIQAGGPYGDLSRLMIVRLESKLLKRNDNLQNQVFKLLQGFEDQRLLPIAYFSALQILRETNLENETIGLAQEFALRFPNHPLLDDSLLLAAQILFQKKDFSAALLLLKKISQIKGYQADRINDALYLKGEIYLSDWPQRSPLRACTSLQKAFNNESNSISSNRIDSLYRLHCTGF